MQGWRRRKDLHQLIKECVDINNLSRDESLLSELKETSILPIKAIVKHQWFYAMNLSEDDIISVCNRMENSQLKVVYCPDPCISLPYFVDLQILIISDIPDTKQAEFRGFLESIVGHNQFEVHPNGIGSFRTRFADNDTGLGVLASFNYCTFKGKHLTVTPQTSLVPIADKPPLCPIPVHKKRSQQRKQKLKSQGKEPENLSVVITAKISENTRIPNAYSRSGTWRR